jgi:hypothetical protein
VRGGGWLRWTGKSTTPWEASLRCVGAPGPTEEERGKLVRSGDSEPVAETGAEAVASLLTDRKPVARTLCKEGGVHMYPRDRRTDVIARMEARACGEWDSSMRWQGGAHTHATNHSEGVNSCGLT